MREKAITRTSIIGIITNVFLAAFKAGATSIVESGKKILHPEVPDYKVVTIVIVVASVIIKLLLQH